MNEEFVPTAEGIEAMIDQLVRLERLGWATVRGDGKAVKEALDTLHKFGRVEIPKEWGK